MEGGKMCKVGSWMLYFGRVDSSWGHRAFFGSSWGHRAFFDSSWGEKVITP